MNAAKQASARVILESSVQMARNLGITSVAEGVETRADFDLLCQLRCDMAQGYFIARPMEYMDFTGLGSELETARLQAGVLKRSDAAHTLSMTIASPCPTPTHRLATA